MPSNITLINGLILLTMGLWGYFTTSASTALIAPAFGLLFLVLYPLFKKGNKAVVHIVVLLTFLLIIALFRPFSKAMGSGDAVSIFRVALMMFSCVAAFIIYIKSFVDARKNRA